MSGESTTLTTFTEGTDGETKMETRTHNADSEYSPTRDLDTGCLSFTISGPWGHFRRVEGNQTSRTYKLIPRTTISGLLAGMLGIGRDEYYDIFDRDHSQIAVTPESQLRTYEMPLIHLSTDYDTLETTHGGRKVQMRSGDGTQARQRVNHEMLVNPAYRIDISLHNQNTYEELRERLSTRRFVYTPSLGKSECVNVRVDYHGELEIQSPADGETYEVVSAVPDAGDEIVPTPGEQLHRERSPGDMETYEAGRRTTDWISWTVPSPDSNVKVTKDISEAQLATIDGRIVAFS